MVKRRSKRWWVVTAFLALFCGVGLVLTLVHPFSNLMRANAMTMITRGDVYRDADGEELPYRLMMPLKVKRGQTYPLVLSLHGGGCEGTDNTVQLMSVVPIFTTAAARRDFPSYVLAPQCPPGTAWVDERAATADGYRFPTEPSMPLRMALELVERLPDEYPIDRDRIYVVGYSRGATGGWDALIRRPDLFTAGVLLCGRGVPARAAGIADIPVWVAHGAHDDAISADCSRAMVRALRAAGGNPRYLEYLDGDHNVGWNALQDPDLMPWLFARRRGE